MKKWEYRWKFIAVELIITLLMTRIETIIFFAEKILEHVNW